MAKKKKRSNLGKICALISLVFAIAVFALMFAQAVVIKNSDGKITNQYTGSVIAFGKSLRSIDGGSFAKSEKKIDFSFGLVFAYLAPLVFTLVLALIGLATKKNNGAKLLLGFLAFACFVSAFVLILKAPVLSTITTNGSSEILGGSATTTMKLSEAGYQLGWGSIVNLVVCGLGAFSTLTYTATKLLKK